MPAFTFEVLIYIAFIFSSFFALSILFKTSTKAIVFLISLFNTKSLIGLLELFRQL